MLSAQPIANCLIIFGEALRELRAASGYSQEALAERAGIDRSYLGGIERGEHNLALINIVKIANALGIYPHELLIIYSKQISEKK
jgi:transcriptional regulator with XRE-family HTH domain